MVGTDIIAQLIWSGSSVSQYLPVFDPKTLAIAGGMGTVIVGNIRNNEFVPNDYGAQFSYPCKKYYSLRNGSLIWGFGLRDFYIADLKNGFVKEELASHKGNEWIVQMDIVDFDKPTLYVDITKTNWGEYIQRGLIYDPIEKKVIDTTKDYQGEFFLLPNGNILFEKFNHKLPPTWKIGTGFKDSLYDNKLTDELNNKGVTVWAISYSYKNNFMIGFNSINDRTVYYSIFWANNFEDVKIEPLTFHQEKDIVLWDHFEISSDGKWAKTVARNYSTEKRTDDITFFAVNDSFPQSLSPPIYGGRSTRDGGGCFVETDDWGTVYVDISPEAPGYLVVYKMSDVMNKVVEKMRKLGR